MEHHIGRLSPPRSSKSDLLLCFGLCNWLITPQKFDNGRYYIRLDIVCVYFIDFPSTRNCTVWPKKISSKKVRINDNVVEIKRPRHVRAIHSKSLKNCQNQTRFHRNIELSSSELWLIHFHLLNSLNTTEFIDDFTLPQKKKSSADSWIEVKMIREIVNKLKLKFVNFLFVRRFRLENWLLRLLSFSESAVGVEREIRNFYWLSKSMKFTTMYTTRRKTNETNGDLCEGEGA